MTEPVPTTAEAQLRAAFPKRHKYNAKKTVVDGITFDSAAEAKRYGELKLLERMGQITFLELQPKYPCIVDGKTVCTWRGDFRYWQNQRMVVEDVKGVRTPLYKLKKKLVEALYGFEIQEVKA